jgi:hypothetical protein
MNPSSAVLSPAKTDSSNGPPISAQPEPSNTRRCLWTLSPNEGSIPFTRSNPLLEPIRWLSATNPIADSHKQSHIVKDSSYSFVIVFSFLVHRVHRGTGENVEPVGYFFGWKLSRLN